MRSGAPERLNGAPAIDSGYPLVGQAPWPPLRQTWWVFALGLGAVALFVFAFLLRVLCVEGHCAGPLMRRVFGLDALGSVPRLFIVGQFLSAAVLAWLALRRSPGLQRRWWAAVTAILGTLAVGKLVGAHATVKTIAPGLTLLAATITSVLCLAVLLRSGRRHRVRAAPAVVLALGLYSAAALGLDGATTTLEILRGGAGFVGWTAGTLVEELGEALTALAVVVAVRWNVPRAAPRTS